MELGEVKYFALNQTQQQFKFPLSLNWAMQENITAN